MNLWSDRPFWATEQIELTMGLQRDWGGCPCPDCIRLNFKNEKISKSACPTFGVVSHKFLKNTGNNTFCNFYDDCWLMFHTLKFLQIYFWSSLSCWMLHQYLYDCLVQNYTTMESNFIVHAWTMNINAKTLENCSYKQGNKIIHVRKLMNIIIIFQIIIGLSF